MFSCICNLGLISTTALDFENTYHTPASTSNNLRTAEKITQALSSSLLIFNAIASLNGICYPSIQCVHIVVQLIGIGCLVREAVTAKPDCAITSKIVMNSLVIIRLVYEIRRFSPLTMAVFRLPFNRIWITITLLELTSRFAFLYYRSKSNFYKS